MGGGLRIWIRCGRLWIRRLLCFTGQAGRPDPRLFRGHGIGPPVQPNKASSTDERLPDLRAIVAATTLQSLARESLLASLARRQASTYAAPPKSEISASASEEIASRRSCGRW